MLENKKNVRKLRNIIIALIVIIMILGIYIKINYIQTEGIETDIIAIDCLGHMKNEEFILEAKKIDDELYEIELPKNVNTKKVAQITSVTLEDLSNEAQEGIEIEVIDNKIKLTKEQIENYKINLDIQYDGVIKQKNEDGTIETTTLSDKTKEEIQQLEQTNEIEILYSQMLKQEIEKENSSIELTGKLPENVKLQVKEVSQDKIKEIFGDVKIDVAYDIKILKDETIKIDPKDFEEICEVTITDANIAEKSKVYHVKEDNTYEQVNVTGGEEGKVSFEAQSFSTYAISDDEIIPDEGEETGALSAPQIKYDTGNGPTGWYYWDTTSPHAFVFTTPVGGSIQVRTYSQEYVNGTPEAGMGCYIRDDVGVHNHVYETWYTLTGPTQDGEKVVWGAYGYRNAAHSSRWDLTIVTPPKIEVTTESCNWRNTSLPVTINISNSDYLDDNSAKEYYLSQSSTELTGGIWTTYTSGTEFNINPGTSGTYYLFVKRVQNECENGSQYPSTLNDDSTGTNVTLSDGVSYHRFGPYKFNTTLTSSTIDLDKGTINPIYKPEWGKLSSAYDATDKTLSVTVKGSAYKSQVINSNVTINYASDVTSTLSAEDITVFVNGVEVTSTVNPTVTVNAGTTSTNGTSGKTEITHTITLSNLEEAARRANLPYKELSGNIAIKIGGRGQDTSTYTANVLKDEYGNQNMMETDQNGTNEDGTWIDVTYSDPDTNRNTSNKMFADFIKPEFTYESSNTIIGDGNHGNTKKVTVVFDVTDKYFNGTTLTANDITINLIDTDPATAIDPADITKTLTKTKEIIINEATGEITYQDAGYTIQTGERKIGERYELLIEGLEQLDENGISNGYTYSGPMSIAFSSGKVTDLSGNVNDGTTITIGVDETDGNANADAPQGGEIVDVVDPVWELGDVDLENATIKLIAKDKYFDAANSVRVDDITVYVNNSESTAITKTITGPVEKVAGQEYEYTLQLSNITLAEAGYTTFTPTNLTTDNLNNTAGFKYKSENGGDISIKIATGTIKDQSGNTSREQSFEIGNIDVTKPEVYDAQKIQAVAANTETFIFNVTDRNYDPSDLIELNEITLWIDNVQLDSLRNSASLTSKEIKATIDGTTKVLGHQYTLIIPNIAETLKQEGKSYLEWSGTVEIRIAENAAKDKAGNTLNTTTTTITDFVDWIKPEFTYAYSSTNPTLDGVNNTITVVFEVTDKYYSNSVLQTSDITATMTKLDGTEIPISSTTLTAVDKTATFNKTVSGAVTNGTYTIGKTYTLTLTAGENTGTVSIAIPEGKISDTSNNTNANQIITIGINIPEGTGSEKILDLTNPTISVDNGGSTTAWHNSTVNVKITAADDYSGLSSSNSYRYFLSNSLTPSTVGTWTDYDQTGETAINLNPGISGIYYLFVKRVSDNVGNISTLNGEMTEVESVTYHRFGPYQFDYDRPTLTVNPTTCTWRNSAMSVTITHNDTGGSGIASTSGQYFLTTELSPTAVPTGLNVSGTYTSGTEFSINPLTSGEYYLYVKQISDNATNTSNTTEYVTIDGVTYHRYGIYQFDYDLPEWSYVSKDIYLTNPNDVGNDNYANADRTVKIVFKGTDITSNATSSITANASAITIISNGVDVTNNTTKTWNIANNGTQEVTGTLTITGITGDGALTVVIPEGTLTDQAGNTNINTSLSTEINIEIDNTNPNVDLHITSPGAGKYKAGQVITITATYNENVYKEITSNNLIDTPAEAPVMALAIGGIDAEGTVTCTAVNGKVLTYTYTITDGDNGRLTVKSLATAYDAAGNAVSASNVTPSIEIIADTINPTITATPDKTTNGPANDYVKSQTVTITAVDPVANGSSSGLLSSNSYKYYLSNSSTALSGGSWLPYDYTGTNPVTIGEGKTGTYYLFVKAVSDVAGNVSSTNGEIITVPDPENGNVETTCHKFGEYKFDNTAPETSLDMLLGSAAGSAYTGTINGTTFTGNWTNQSVYVEPKGSDDHSGVASITYTVDGGSATSLAQILNPGDENEKEYTVIVTVTDNVGNTATSGDYIIRIDKIKPTLTITSDTTSPTNVENITYTFTFSENVTDFTKDDITVANGTKGTFTKISDTVYTLVVSTIDDTVYTETVSVAADKCIDKAGNGNVAATSTDILVDRVDPTITVTPEKTTNASGNDYMKSQSITITATDVGTALSPSNVYEYYLSESSTELLGGSWTGYDYTGTTPETIGEGKTGTYYLFVRTVSDTVGNISSTNGDTTTISGTHKFGPYKFDNTNPYWTTENFNVDYTNKKVTVDLIGTDEHSGYRANTLDTGDIEVWVDGTKITDVIKELSSASAVTEGIKYTLTLSNFEEAARQYGKSFKEWSGSTKIVITADTLEDKAGMDLGYTGNKNEQQEFVLGHVDLINPEFTYESANTIIGSGPTGDKKVTVVFDVTDKYFTSTTLLTDTVASLITVKVDNENVNANISKTLTKIQDITDTVNGVANTKVGERYQLEITGLEQLDENGLSNGYTYSGPMTITIPAGVKDASGNLISGIIDSSGNLNVATSITIGVDDTDGNPGPDTSDDGTIVDVVDPIWELGDVNLESGTIKLRAKDKYFDTCIIDESKITVYVNGVESIAVAKDITSTTPTNIYDTVNGVENTLVGKEYTLKLSNITPAEAGYTTFTPTNLSELNNTAGFKYRNENGGDISIKIAAGTIKDQSGNTSREQSFEIGKIDATKPEVYDVQKIQDTTAKTETFIFNVTDRNYDPSDLVTEGEITVWVDGTQVTSIVKVITSKEIKANIDETTKVLGHQYTLVLSNIAETLKQEGKSYLEWSGTVEIRIAENAAKDLSGNTLNTDTTTISDFVDYIKPVIEPVTVTNPINRTHKTYTMSFNVIDKYLDTTNMVTESEITVYVDGEEATSIVKALTSTEIKETFKKTVDGVVEATATEHVIGHKYTLVLSDFEQALKQAGKDFMEWSGTVKIEIAQNAVKDTTNNTLAPEVAKRTVNGELVDFIKPVVEKVSSTRDNTAKTETIIFNVMDKYLDTSDALLGSEIKVYVDDEEVAVDYTNSSSTGLDGTFSKVATFVMNKETKVTTTQSANYAVTDTEQVVGQQYQLVLSNFEQASRNAKDYKDYSGTVKIEIVENAVKDTSNNTLATEVAKRTVAGDFVDFIKPELEYIHGTSDIDHTSKTYTMTFDVTDKYYTSGQFTAQDIIDGNIEILMQNGQKDSNGNAIVYNLKNEPVTITLTPVAKYAPAGTKVTNTSGEIVTTTENSHQIGHTYTLKIEHLEKLEIKEGLTTADYSGVITVGIPADRIKDRTIDESSNKNIATTITSGVDIPGGTLPDDAVAVDVVDPIWTKVSASASAIDPENKESSTATITFKGTDTYFDQNTFTIDKLKVIVNGAEVTTGITKTLDSTTTLTEERIKNNGLTSAEVETVQYGVQYTVTIKGFAQNANQVKIRIPKGLLVDEHGNDSEETDLIVYNVLKSAASETAETSAFLGEAVATTIYPEGVTEVTPIERQNIERVEFVNGIAGSKATGVQRVWDVSAQGDGSIIAWTSNATAPYTVYIGSNDEIFANQDSRNLFRYIGYGTNCTATEAVTNLNLLNVKSVTNMNCMFYHFGFRAMTSLTLPTTFDTSNVTSMADMFTNCGHRAMTTLNIGTNFNTSKVTTMSNMFNACGYNNLTSLDLSSGADTTNTTQFDTSQVTNMNGMFLSTGYTAMTSLNLGNNFDTTNVTSMAYMFSSTGYTAMTSLSLGDKFDTSSVTNMYRMFNGCGYTAMTSLDLGDKFDTSSVTDMNKMFESCGYTAMTSLDLGNLFYTTNVQDMYKMFHNCGKTAMTKLDLGPAFTKIPNGTITKQASDYVDWELDKALEYNAHDDFITDCGASNLVIYVAEKVYYDKNTFKLGQ